MISINKQNLNSLLTGSSFFATGGGLPVKINRSIYNRLLAIKKNLPVKEIEEFGSNDYLVSVYGVGDPSRAKGSFANLVKKAVKEYEKLSGRKIKGIIPGEIGAEALAFQAAAFLNLPVVDSDLVGGRAAPEIQMDVFSAFDVLLTPLLAETENGKSIFILGNFKAREIEEITRNFFRKNSGSGVVVGYPIKAGDYVKIGAKKTISMAIEAGKLLLEKRLNDIFKKLGGRVFAEAIIRKAELRGDGDFLRGKICFSDFDILVKNENIAIFRNGKMMAVAPDPIIILDSQLNPVHNTEIKNICGKKAIIVLLPSIGCWKNKEKRKLWLSALKQ